MPDDPNRSEGGSLATQLEQLVERFDAAWNAGKRPRIDEFLGDETLAKNPAGAPETGQARFGMALEGSAGRDALLENGLGEDRSRSARRGQAHPPEHRCHAHLLVNFGHYPKVEYERIVR